MVKKIKMVYQLKITLKDINPPIWRRIQVPATYTFEELHHAIQSAMGWEDCHLHEFSGKELNSMVGWRIGTLDGDWPEDHPLSEDDHLIKNYISLDNPKIQYIYDFGDGWRHTILLEKIVPALEKVEYPMCTGGRRACPLEDCGGPFLYPQKLKILSNPSHEDYDMLTQWVGGSFDPEAFDRKQIKFLKRDEIVAKNEAAWAQMESDLQCLQR